MPKSVVSIVKGTDAGKMVEEALSLLGGVGSLIKPGSVWWSNLMPPVCIRPSVV